MKNSKTALYPALIIAAFSMMMMTGGCKKKDDLKNFTGTYTITYHEHYDIPGAPPPSGVCDSTSTMTMTLSAVGSDKTRLQFDLEDSKLYCQSQSNWCFTATQNSSDNLSGSGFLSECSDAAPYLIVTSGTLSVSGRSISGSVHYTEHPGPTIPFYFEFNGTKN